MDGIILINKPKGISSFDVIRKLRRILKEKKIGHTGTLDPLATGLMILCLGKATKLASDIEAENKVYIAEFDFGYSTDTYDVEGKILEKDNKIILKEDLEKILTKFLGKQRQVPPMYSAIKVDGKKLYELARKGIEIERTARDINIEYINLLKYRENKAKIEVKVSKGTYIRSLIFDIGKELGTFATMTSLERTRVGYKSLKDSFILENIEKMTSENDFSFIKNIEIEFNFTKYFLKNEKEKKLFLNGNTVKLDEKFENKKYRIYYDNEFLGLGEIKKNILLKGYKYY